MPKDTHHISPPKWANRFLEWYCAHDLLDEIQGDLLEAFFYRKVDVGITKAKIWFVWDVLRFFRPSSFKKQSYNSNQIAMLKNYLLVSLRNFSKHKGYSSINLLGLIVGISACLLISLHVLEEITYDNFHPDSDRTYRVVMDLYTNNELKIRSAPVFPAVALGLANDFPEIEMFNRILPFGDGVYSHLTSSGELIRYNEENAVLADANFFQIFGFELVDGLPENVLAKPHSIVLSETAARRYFGSDNPIGKEIFWRGDHGLTVTGVFKDFPENSHMQFDMIQSLNSWEDFDEWGNEWGWYDFLTFVKVANGVSQSELDAKLEGFLDVKKAESFAARNNRQVLWSQNIGDIHLYSSGLSWDMGENGGVNQIYFLAIIAALILLIAWVNYVNLATARAIKRAKEVGVRKVIGAKKEHLVFQFLTESFLYNLFAVVISFVIVWICIPIISRALDLTLETSILFSFQVIFAALLLIIIGTVCSGLYPAMILTSFVPVKVLKGQTKQGNKKIGFRQVLVIFQFTASITLILGTYLVVKQLNFMKGQDLGLNIEQTLVLRAPTSGQSDDDLIQRLQTFRNEMESFSEVKGFATSNNVPGVENFAISGFFSTHYPSESRNCYRVVVDDEFLPMFEVDLVAGRTFNQDFVTDTAAMVINELAVRHLGFESAEEAIGEKINPNSEQPWTIIGVVKDYHQATLKEDVDPVVFSYNRRRGGSFYSIKLHSEDYKVVMEKVEASWDNLYPDNPFDFFFLDELFDRQYKTDEQFNAVFVGFAILAIFVACLGLFGLVSFTAEQSRKEIGIRKVLGASTSTLVLLLAKDYAKLILIAIILAFPLGYFLMSQWLESFAYRTHIGVGMFVFGGVAISIFAFVTVSFKSFAAANGNPVNALRDE